MVFLTQIISVVWTVGRFQKLNRITDYSARMESGRLPVSKKSFRHFSCQNYYILQLHLEYLLIFVIYTEVWKFLSSPANGKLRQREIKLVVWDHMRNMTMVLQDTQ